MSWIMAFWRVQIADTGWNMSEYIGTGRKPRCRHYGNTGTSGADRAFAGLEKWSFDNATGQWVLDYTMQDGLGLGTYHTVGDYFPTASDGLRNITGIVNADGSVTIYGVTSTVSTSGDKGPVPNEIVAITDALAATTLPTDEMFSIIDAPQYGVVYRGIASDRPRTIVLLGSAFAGLGAVRRRRRAL
jgi:hypothetical protein